MHVGSVHLHIQPSVICLFIHPPTHLFVCLPARPSVHPSVNPTSQSSHHTSFCTTIWLSADCLAFTVAPAPGAVRQYLPRYSTSITLPSTAATASAVPRRSPAHGRHARTGTQMHVHAKTLPARPPARPSTCTHACMHTLLCLHACMHACTRARARTQARIMEQMRAFADVKADIAQRSAPKGTTPLLAADGQELGGTRRIHARTHAHTHAHMHARKCESANARTYMLCTHAHACTHACTHTRVLRMCAGQCVVVIAVVAA